MKTNIFLIFLIAVSTTLKAQWVSIYEQQYADINDLQFANVNTIGQEDSPGHSGHNLLIKIIIKSELVY